MHKFPCQTKSWVLSEINTRKCLPKAYHFIHMKTKCIQNEYKLYETFICLLEYNKFIYWNFPRALFVAESLLRIPFLGLVLIYLSFIVDSKPFIWNNVVMIIPFIEQEKTLRIWYFQIYEYHTYIISYKIISLWSAITVYLYHKHGTAVVRHDGYHARGTKLIKSWN